MDNIVAAIIGLFDIIVTSLFGIYMMNIGAKNERKKALVEKKIDIYIEFSGVLESLQRSIKIFATLRMRNSMSKTYNLEDLNKDLIVYDTFASEFYNYYKSSSGKIRLLCPETATQKASEIHDLIVKCRDEYQMILEGDWGGATKEEFDSFRIKALYNADAQMRGKISPDIDKCVESIISILTKDIREIHTTKNNCLLFH